MIDSKPSSSGEDGLGCVGSVNVGEHHGELPAHLDCVLAGSHEFLAACSRLERIPVRQLPFVVVAIRRLSHGCAEDPSVTERSTGHLAAELHMLLVTGRVRLLLVQHDRANHSPPLRRRRRERIASSQKEERMGKKVVHVEFAAQDMDRAEKFWEGVGGWSIENACMPGIDYRMFQE